MSALMRLSKTAAQILINYVVMEELKYFFEYVFQEMHRFSIVLRIYFGLNFIYFIFLDTVRHKSTFRFHEKHETMSPVM